VNAAKPIFGNFCLEKIYEKIFDRSRRIDLACARINGPGGNVSRSKSRCVASAVRYRHSGNGND